MAHHQKAETLKTNKQKNPSILTNSIKNLKMIHRKKTKRFNEAAL